MTDATGISNCQQCGGRVNRKRKRGQPTKATAEAREVIIAHRAPEVAERTLR